MTLCLLAAAASDIAAEKAGEAATDTLLFEGAILLGVATLFVLLFHAARARRGAGLSDRGGSRRAARARPRRRRRIETGLCRTRHRLSALSRRPRTPSAPALGTAPRDLRPRAGAGGGQRTDPLRADLRDDGFQLAGGARARPAARPVIDRAGAAQPEEFGDDQRAFRRKGFLDPAVPGSRDRADDHHHRRPVARAEPILRRRRGGRWPSIRSRRSSRSCSSGVSS